MSKPSSRQTQQQQTPENDYIRFARKAKKQGLDSVSTRMSKPSSRQTQQQQTPESDYIHFARKAEKKGLDSVSTRMSNPNQPNQAKKSSSSHAGDNNTKSRKVKPNSRQGNAQPAAKAKAKKQPICQTAAVETDLTTEALNQREWKFKPYSPTRWDLRKAKELLALYPPATPLDLPECPAAQLKVILNYLMKRAGLHTLWTFGKNEIKSYALNNLGCFDYKSLEFRPNGMVEGDPSMVSLLLDLYELITRPRQNKEGEPEVSWIESCDPERSGLVNFMRKAVNLALRQMTKSSAAGLRLDRYKHTIYTEGAHMVTAQDFVGYGSKMAEKGAEVWDFIAAETAPVSLEEQQAVLDEVHERDTERANGYEKKLAASSPQTRRIAKAALADLHRCKGTVPNETDYPDSLSAKLERIYLGLCQADPMLESLANGLLVAA